MAAGYRWPSQPDLPELALARRIRRAISRIWRASSASLNLAGSGSACAARDEEPGRMWQSPVPIARKCSSAAVERQSRPARKRYHAMVTWDKETAFTSGWKYQRRPCRQSSTSPHDNQKTTPDWGHWARYFFRKFSPGSLLGALHCPASRPIALSGRFLPSRGVVLGDNPPGNTIPPKGENHRHDPRRCTSSCMAIGQGRPSGDHTAPAAPSGLWIG